MSARVWVVIPTYNEAENVGQIARAVITELRRLAPDDHQLLIVDDNSPDGTGRLADKLAAEFGAIEVLHRPEKRGIGRAYVAGFSRALDRGAELVVEMDADFSHNPGYLEDLLTAAQSADVVLGSRYIAGGGVRHWGPARRMISRGGSAYARQMLRVEVRDLTGGFKCFHRRVLEGIDLATLRADGYGFQIEVTYRALRAGFKVLEVPIVFEDRTAGNSKMSWRIALEAMILVPRLKRSNPRRLTAS